MTNVEKVSIALTPEIAALVRHAVESGEYASSSEVVREALRDWKLKKHLEQSEIERVRALWSEGLKSGNGMLNSVEEMKAEARRRHEIEETL